MYLILYSHFVTISVCENDFVPYSATGDCYKYFPHLLSWDDARAYCQDNVPYNVGDLASIPDAGTNDFLRTLVHGPTMAVVFSHTWPLISILRENGMMNRKMVGKNLYVPTKVYDNDNE